MRNPLPFLSALALASALPWAVADAGDRFITQNAEITFFSSTPAEDIEASNGSVAVVLDPAENSLAFSVPMQAFAFEKALMQEHFNQERFLHTSEHPRATFRGTITDPDQVDFNTDGEYPVEVKGSLEIRGVERPVTEKGTIVVDGDNLHLRTRFELTLAAYGITFVKGKPATNIADTVEVTVDAAQLVPVAS